MTDENNFRDHVPSISPNMILRREWFGGLVFSRDTMKILEINANTYNLLSHIDGRKSILEIIHIISQELHCDSKFIEDIITRLRSEGVLVW